MTDLPRAGVPPRGPADPLTLALLSAGALVLAVPLAQSGAAVRAVVCVAVVVVVLAVVLRARTSRATSTAVATVAAVVAIAMVGIAAGWVPLTAWPVPVLLGVGAVALWDGWPGLDRWRHAPVGGRWPLWWRAGSATGTDWLVVAGVVAGSAVALVAWASWAEPVRPPFLVVADDLPWWVWVPAFVGFAAVNALAEEALYRGVLQTALERVSPAAVAVTVQAVAFGLAHWGGFPSGWAGVLLSGVYGGALGVVRHRTGGLLLPWVAHVGADLVIAGIGLGLLSAR